MDTKDVKFISKLITFKLYYNIVFQDRDLLREQDLPYYKRLLESYCTYDPNDEVQLPSLPKISLDPTFLDETIIDRLEIEEFYINTGKISTLFLKSFEETVFIDKAFFDAIRDDLKYWNLDDIEETKFTDILNNIERHALSRNWTVNFSDQLFDHKNVLKVILNPSFFIVRTLVSLWVNY